MRVEVVRSGGIIGHALKGTLDLAQLPEPTNSMTALRSLPFGQSPASPRHPDSFRYEVTLIDDDGRQSVVLDEAQIPDDLRSLLDQAIAAGSS